MHTPLRVRHTHIPSPLPAKRCPRLPLSLPAATAPLPLRSQELQAALDAVAVRQRGSPALYTLKEAEALCYAPTQPALSKGEHQAAAAAHELALRRYADAHTQRSDQAAARALPGAVGRRFVPLPPPPPLPPAHAVRRLPAPHACHFNRFSAWR
eukprot:3695799-Pleurochrysis_carterae.AAC.1